MWIQWWEENEIDKKATIKKDLVIKISNAKDWLKKITSPKIDYIIVNNRQKITIILKLKAPDACI